jgi:gamma-glutamylcyclotransferase (GGCT)/AIG2-like uncharacterized protein YtfP
MNIISKLFVYGTLGPGRPNEHVLRNIGGSWEGASVTGKLYQEGWGASMGYPAIVLAKDGVKVEGFLFSSDAIAAHWHELDEFEGDAYERVVAKVKRKDKSVVDAYIYALKA